MKTKIFYIIITGQEKPNSGLIFTNFLGMSNHLNNLNNCVMQIVKIINKINTKEKNK